MTDIFLSYNRVCLTDRDASFKTFTATLFHFSEVLEANVVTRFGLARPLDPFRPFATFPTTRK